MSRTTLNNRTSTTSRSLAVVGLVAAAGLLAGCADDGADAAASDAETATTAEADALTVTDPWTKATDTGMTAAFGEIENDGDADVRIVSATTDASPTAELHTMAEGEDGDMVMTEVEDGFLVPAGGSITLEPGGDHVMIMGVTEAIEPGANVNVTLTLDDGSTLDVVAPARSYSGANESYGEDSGDDADMDHGDMDHGDMDMDADAS
ncbi:copper chaperone PCu(A)C [Paraoerskovia marina]|uniref:copper chaperone PCu(A)C n=1 Tax=Paraoerskovia marina TaxID=545619 RepID=UPI0005B83EEB|nr:copper chaperone PCu(A)C [Paraoerskovia marina]